MSHVPYSPVEVKALCDEVSKYGVKLSRATAWELLRHIKQRGGDRRVAVDAILMKKRPAWLTDIIGPWETK